MSAQLIWRPSVCMSAHFCSKWEKKKNLFSSLPLSWELNLYWWPMTGRRCNVFFSSFFCPTLGLNWPRPHRIPRLSSNPGRSISLFLLGIVAQLRPRGYYVRWNWFWWSTLWYLVQVSVQLRPEACSLIPSLSKKNPKTSRHCFGARVT